MKILYVEDDQILKEIFPEILKSIGYPNDIVDNGIEALKALEKNDYDLVLMDLNMPLMSGIETAKLISIKATIKQKPIIIIMSGLIDKRFLIMELMTFYKNLHLLMN
jgi:CheY-like chemotaxis protein